MELKPFTVLIGENNTGKTNLLHAMGLVLSDEQAFRYGRRLDIDDITYSAMRAFKEQLLDTEVSAEELVFPEVSVRIVLTDFDAEQEAVVGDWFINPELTEAALTYVFRYRSPKQAEWVNLQREKLKAIGQAPDEEYEPYRQRLLDSLDFPIKDYEYAIYGGDDPSRRIDTYFLRMLGFELLNALRDSNRELVTSDRGRLLYRVLASRDEEKYSDLKQDLADLAHKVDQNEELSKITSAISKQLCALSLHTDDADSTVRFLFSHPETAELLKRFTLAYGTSPVDVLRNGLGRNNLLYIALVLSHLYETDNTYTRCVFRFIGIEEPEAHLHPDLQEHLARNISAQVAPTNQILITSHSAHIASKLHLENLAILYKDENNQVCHHYALEGFGSTAEDKKSVHYLHKYLDTTRSAMFFSRYLILVEGISEQLILPWLFKSKFGREPATLKCCIINVQGLAFKHFLRVICNGYFIRCSVLTDSDTGTKAENRASDLAKGFAHCTAVAVEQSTEPTFERDLVVNNETGVGRDTLLEALRMTRPLLHKDYVVEIGDEPLQAEAFYQMVKDHKAEFAYNLNELLKQDPTLITIPPYIEAGFDHLFGVVGDEEDVL